MTATLDQIELDDDLILYPLSKLLQESLPSCSYSTIQRIKKSGELNLRITLINNTEYTTKRAWRDWLQERQSESAVLAAELAEKASERNRKASREGVEARRRMGQLPAVGV